MSRGKDQYVIPHKNGWAVKGAGNAVASRVVETIGEATVIAMRNAAKQHSSVKVFGTDEVFNLGI